jgi:2,5-diketo-D-gluconate reductase A
VREAGGEGKRQSEPCVCFVRSTPMTDLTLNDGHTMPQLGMGTWQIPDSQAAAIVRTGLDIGFRLVDTAAIYDNERGVGDGYKGADAFLTTKLWNDRQGDAAAAMDESLALLGVESVDLYLMHWPVPSADKFVDAWRAMIALRDAGKAKSIGVSNFLPEHIDAIVAATGVTPTVNQIELHPNFQQRAQREYHEAHSPWGRGRRCCRTRRSFVLPTSMGGALRRWFWLGIWHMAFR